MDIGLITKTGLCSRIAKEWYPLTIQFMRIYGKEMVPFDVRWAINDVERNCIKTRQTTTWPLNVIYEK